MGNPEFSSRRPATRREFATALEALVRASIDNGVDIFGGYSFTDHGESPDPGIEIYAVKRRTENQHRVR